MLTVMQGYTASTTVAASLRFQALFTENMHTSTFFALGSLLGCHMLFFPAPCKYVSFSGLAHGHTFQYPAKACPVISLDWGNDSDL